VHSTTLSAASVRTTISLMIMIQGFVFFWKWKIVVSWGALRGPDPNLSRHQT